MLSLVILVTILIVCFSLPVEGTITISSKPSKVANGQSVQLICDVGTMQEAIKWEYNGTTFYSCDPPYTNCDTNSVAIGSDFYEFSINENILHARLIVDKDKNAGNWTCYHGNENVDFDIDNEDAPKITDFDRYRGENRSKTLFCNIESKVPADVLIYSQSYRGITTWYTVEQSTDQIHDNITVEVACSDYHYFCNVTNGYGPTVTATFTATVECPLEVLRDLSNTNETFTDATQGVDVYIYYEGFPPPSTTLRRVLSEEIVEVTQGQGLRMSNVDAQPTEPAKVYLFVYPLSKDLAGKYIVTLNQENITETVVVTLNYSNDESGGSNGGLGSGGGLGGGSNDGTNNGSSSVLDPLWTVFIFCLVSGLLSVTFSSLA